MIFDGESSTSRSMPSSEMCIFEQVILTVCGLAVTLTYDLLTSKFNQFILVWTTSKLRISWNSNKRFV